MIQISLICGRALTHFVLILQMLDPCSSIRTSHVPSPISARTAVFTSKLCALFAAAAAPLGWPAHIRCLGIPLGSHIARLFMRESNKVTSDESIFCLMKLKQARHFSLMNWMISRCHILLQRLFPQVLCDNNTTAFCSAAFKPICCRFYTSVYLSQNEIKWPVYVAVNHDSESIKYYDTSFCFLFWPATATDLDSYLFIYFPLKKMGELQQDHEISSIFKIRL